MILTIPHPGLRKKCLAVAEGEDANPIVVKLIAALGSRGLGLAAPQIGILKRVCLIGTDRGEIAMVNPVIVARHTGVTVEFRTTRGARQSLAATGMTARCIQHELDHLDGILFTDRAR